MEQPSGMAGAWQRPRILARLCTLSFINQGVAFPCYLIGLPGAYMLQRLPREEVRQLVDAAYAHWLVPEQREMVQAYVDLLREHGVALMAVLALRTLARALGTWRMWAGWKDGFHIYTTAQLLGILVPLWIAGRHSFNLLGFFIALNWCYLYFTQRNALREAGAPVPHG